ncbi:OstA-like protein [Rhodohalobacter sp.]|uniref:OstA-like protein n=1 Tax=Rhodohalobacter sp. TaxID=1974210 RepID=UPI00356B0237
MKVPILHRKAAIIFLGILFLVPTIVLSQTRVNILGADDGEGTVINGQLVQKLLGNVKISTESMMLDADSVYQFTEENLFHAFNIQIETESEMIWADTLYYNTLTDYSELRGRVIIQSETNTVFSNAMDAALALDLIIFSDPIRFEDERGTLLAESGLYYQDVDSAAFRGNVQLADSTQYLESDSLFMNRQEDLYELFGRVYAEDFEDKVIFTGDYLYADSTGYRLLEGEDAWLMELSDSESDTTHLLAKKIELLETDSTSTMDAFEDVRIWSTKFSALADTALYRDHEEKFELRSNPKLWQKNIQLTGPVIEAHLENGDIRFLSSYPRPIAVQEDTVTGRLHQMAGDTLHAFFNDGVVERIVVFDESEIIFHQRDENDEPDGLIELVAQGSSTMYFLDGEFDLFKAERNIDGSYLPESPENVNRQLDNFSWNPEQKPRRPMIQIPRLPAIPEERPFDLPPRYLRYLENNQN